MPFECVLTMPHCISDHWMRERERQRDVCMRQPAMALRVQSLQDVTTAIALRDQSLQDRE